MTFINYLKTIVWSVVNIGTSHTRNTKHPNLCHSCPRCTSLKTTERLKILSAQNLILHRQISNSKPRTTAKNSHQHHCHSIRDVVDIGKVYHDCKFICQYCKISLQIPKLNLIPYLNVYKTCKSQIKPIF